MCIFDRRTGGTEASTHSSAGCPQPRISTDKSPYLNFSIVFLRFCARVETARDTINTAYIRVDSSLGNTELLSMPAGEYNRIQKPDGRD